MSRPNRLVSPRRGEIYLVSFDPTVGAEIQKTRPALVIQNDVANAYSAITIVATISSKFDENLYPTEVLISASSSGLLKKFGSVTQPSSIHRSSTIASEIGTSIRRNDG